jgi:hypothetical protein
MPVQPQARHFTGRFIRSFSSITRRVSLILGIDLPESRDAVAGAALARVFRGEGYLTARIVFGRTSEAPSGPFPGVYTEQLPRPTGNTL